MRRVPVRQESRSFLRADKSLINDTVDIRVAN